MNEHEQNIQIIEVTIEEAKKQAAKGKLAQRLTENKDFKKLILDGYFADEAARLVHLLSEPNIDETIRGHVIRDMNGIGALKRYLQTIIKMGRMADQLIEENEITLEELRQEAEGLVITSEEEDFDGEQE